MATNPIRAIGLMSGTSLDGVDAALLETDGHTVTGLGPSLTLPYPAALRARLRQLLDDAPTLPPDNPTLLAVEHELTTHHADAIRALGQPADLIGFHGQTILHTPQAHRTWQIGNAAQLAHATGLPIACDFRLADVAAGGQGAPLAPVLHATLAVTLPRPLAVLNIGGVANLTWIGCDNTMLACDTGPGNALLDDWALRHTGRPMDQDGALAAAGTPDSAALATLLSDSWFARPPPKSLDRQHFSHALAIIAGLSPADGAATLAAFTAGAVAATPLPAPPSRWLVSGGGRRNPTLMRALRRALHRPVDTVESVGWDGDALEAQCFALLAVRVARALPLTFPGTTGAPRPLPGGRIVQPSCPPSRAPS